MNQIVLNGLVYTYTITRKKIRSLTLHLTNRRQIAVAIPWFTPKLLVPQFIRSNTDWILKNSAKIAPKKSLTNLNKLVILDKTYKLDIKKSSRDSVVIFEEEQKIYANTTRLTSAHLKKLFDQKFRPLALKLIRQELASLSQKHGFKYHRVSIKNTTSRFGSCSSQNNLNFNWQIIFLPEVIFRHILLHELTHTIHHNHSGEFWFQLSHYDPNYQQHRRYLRTHAQKHFLI